VSLLFLNAIKAQRWRDVRDKKAWSGSLIVRGHRWAAGKQDCDQQKLAFLAEVL